MPTPDEFLVSANHLLEDLVALRRKLHQIPEFALDLPQTQQMLLSELEGLGEITLGKSLSSIVLVIRGGSPGPTVLLRADAEVARGFGKDFGTSARVQIRRRAASRAAR